MFREFNEGRDIQKQEKLKPGKKRKKETKNMGGLVCIAR